MSKVAVVSGSNTGIGLAIVRALCKQLGENGVVYLTSRNEARGQVGMDTLKKEGLTPRFHQLNVDDQASMERLRDDIKNEHGGLDILVNNAGVAYKGNDTPMSEQAEGSVRTNYYGVLHMTDLFLPLIRDCGRIVHVASMVSAMMYYKISEDLQNQFKAATTVQASNALMDKFVADVKAGDHVAKGWADWSYGASKLGVTTLTKIQGQAVSQDTSKKDVLINCCCPGYVTTNMTAHHNEAMLKNQITPDHGADTPVYLALLPPGTTDLQGQFLSRRRVKDFYNNDIRPITFSD